jgi:hypothetical protein
MDHRTTSRSSAARIRSRHRAALVAALFAGAAGCAGAGPSSLPQDGQPGASAIAAHRFRPAATYPTNETLLFVSENVGSGHIGIYLAKTLKKNRPPIAEITDVTSIPYGLALDAVGTLYVADNSNSNITEYPKGQTTHSVTITDGVSNPLGLAIDSKGTLYVSNIPGAIQEYAHGATSPTKTITGGLTAPFGLALDKKQNLYVADFIAAQVFEIPKGSSTVKSLNLQDLTDPVGVCFDASGNLWVTNGNGGSLNVYPPGKTAPSQTISGYTNAYAIGSDAQGSVVVSNTSGPNTEIYAYKPGQYNPYATLNKGVVSVTGLLLAKP